MPNIKETYDVIVVGAGLPEGPPSAIRSEIAIIAPNSASISSSTGCAKRAAEIVNLGIRLNETFRQHADHRNDIGIAGNRALDHIREAIHRQICIATLFKHFNCQAHSQAAAYG